MTSIERLEYMKSRFPQLEKEETRIELGLPAMILPSKNDVADEMSLLDTVVEHQKDVASQQVGLT